MQVFGVFMFPPLTLSDNNIMIKLLKSKITLQRNEANQHNHLLSLIFVFLLHSIENWTINYLHRQASGHSRVPWPHSWRLASLSSGSPGSSEIGKLSSTCCFLWSSWGVRYQAQTKGDIRQLGAQTSSSLLGTHLRKQLSIVEQTASLLKANADARILSTILCLASGNPVINEILKSPCIGACECVLGYKYRHYSLVKSQVTLLTLALFTQPQQKHTSSQEVRKERGTRDIQRFTLCFC